MKALPQRISRTVGENRLFFVFFFILLGVYGLWWASFFPAIMTADSVWQWSQATTGQFNNASPYFHALLMRLTRFVYDSPATFIGLQLTLFAGTVASILNYLAKRGVNLLVVWATFAVFIVLPQFGIYNVTLWKDVPYSLLTLILGFLVYRYGDDERFRASRWSLGSIAVASAFLPLFRFNGLPFLIVPAAIFLLLRRITWAKASKLVAATLAIFVVFNTILPRILDVTPAPIMIEGLTLKTVGAIYALDDPELTTEERAAFEEILPEEKFEELYTPTSVNYLFNEAAVENHFTMLSPAIDSDPKVVEEWHEAVVSALLRNPEAYVYDRVEQAEVLLGVTKNPYKYQIENQTIEGTPPILNTHVSQRLYEKIISYIQFTDTDPEREYAFWATWPIALLGLLYFVLACVKRRWNTAIYISFIFVNLITAIMVVPAIDYRYVYFVHVCMPFVPALYLAEGRKHRVGSEATPGELVEESR